MLKLISQSQPGAFGEMDFLYDQNAEDVLVAVDIRDYKGKITPPIIRILSYPYLSGRLCLDIRRTGDA